MRPPRPVRSTQPGPDQTALQEADRTVLHRLRRISSILQVGRPIGSDKPEVDLFLAWHREGVQVIRRMNSSGAVRLGQGCGIELDVVAWNAVGAGENIEIARRICDAATLAVLPEGLPPGLLGLLRQLASRTSLSPSTRTALAAAGWRAGPWSTTLLPDRADASSAHESLDLLLTCHALVEDPSSLGPLGPLAPLVGEAAARVVARAPAPPRC